MKWIIPVLALLLVTGCSNIKQDNEMINLPVEPNIDDERQIDGIYKILPTDQTINGIPFKGNNSYLFFYDIEKTKIRAGILSKDFKINEITLRKDYWIEFYESGKLKTGQLANNTTIIKGLVFPTGTIVTFAESGVVKKITIEQNITINIKGIEYRNEVAFHPNGQIAYGWLAKDQTIQGQNLEKGKKITLSEDGKIIWE